MLLADATSKEQVQAALDAGDAELQEDIEYSLEVAATKWRNRESGELDSYDIQDVIATDGDFRSWVIDCDSRLTTLDETDVRDALVWAAQHSRRGPRGRRSYGPFYESDDGGFNVPVSRYYTFDDRFLPTNYAFIPDDMATEFWSNFGGIEWDSEELGDNSGSEIDTDSVYIDYDQGDFEEWVADLVRETFAALLKRDAPAAIEAFMKAIGGSVEQQLRTSGLSSEDLLALAQRYFEAEDQETADGVRDDIREYMTAMAGSAEPREVVGEWSREDLREMGITRGPLYEEAPWKLIKLHPSDFRTEGMLMRHCVGDSGMGYIKAAVDGEIEIWSLRSHKNKPRFTLEVDESFHEADGMTRLSRDHESLIPVDREHRGQAIKQLKGKGNRTPGYADKHAAKITLPDEVLFWAHALEDLDIDPGSVDDFPAWDEPFPLPLRRNSGGFCTGFDVPYQPLRR